MLTSITVVSSVPVEGVAHGGLRCPPSRAILCLLRGKPTMFDELWSEIADAPGEIFDIPEMQDSKDFDLDDYLKGDYDY
jgi:hypothetical protein